MEYKVGDRFVVEIKQEFVSTDGQSRYYMLGGIPEVLFNDQCTLADLERYNDELAYRDGYQKGVEDSYKNGFEDGKTAQGIISLKDIEENAKRKGWEEVMYMWRWFVKTSHDDIEKVFPDCGAYVFPTDMVAQYGIPKSLSYIKEFEKAKTNTDLYHYVDAMKEKYSEEDIISALENAGFNVKSIRID